MTELQKRDISISMTKANVYAIFFALPAAVIQFAGFTALATGSGDLMWFSLLHTTAAFGDWLVLWIIRSIKPGSLVEDHPTNAGCYVLGNA